MTSTATATEASSAWEDVENPAAPAQAYKPCCEFTEFHRKCLWGVLLAILIAVTWVAFSELAQNASQPGFDAPFALSYFCTMWVTMFFPAYLLLVNVRGRKSPKDILRDGLRIFQGPDEFKRGPFVGKTAIFCLVWSVTVFTYIKALGLLAAADATALYATNQSFVYMLSWIVLFEKFVAMRILAMIFSITGIVLFAYVDGFGSQAMWGVVVAVAASAGIATYKVLLKKLVGAATLGQISLFLTLIGTINTACLWPIVLALYYTGVEVIDWNQLPWQFICPTAALTVVYQILINYVAVLTYPLFTGLGLAVAIPLCAVADSVWKGREFSGMKIAALVLICIGLLLILLPENWHEVILKPFRVKQQRRDTEQPVGETLRSRLHRTTCM
ncbi:solute carrier family 35 member F4-like [Haliotis rufescens]|uniref:solute carrier family 35 member F4-like n=1 Tax=Haliotis rufescens TaxID=6454 RepID=UPI001EB08C13|nr:solute carrier family 35 member F4-like [Haliotis rufescens]